jgi:hypothetical protein
LRQSGNRWSGEIGSESFPIGTSTTFTNGGKSRVGLFQSNQDLTTMTGGKYNAAEYRDRFKGLADLIRPTAAAESSMMFNRLNTYDRAAFTFGFMQLAAHTPRDNFVLLLRALLTQAKAKDYFPDLTLVAGLVRDRSGQNLEQQDPATGDLTLLMRYFKPVDDRVTQEEATAGGKLMHWMATDQHARDAQVQVATALFQQRWRYFSQKFQIDLRSIPIEIRAPVFVWTMDIRHQGRGSYQAMASAIKGPDPVGSLSAVGANIAGGNRIQTVRAEIGNLPSQIDWSWL